MAWTTNEIAKHKDASSCWVIIEDEVYDVTEFLLKHPGGPGIILKYAGHDATSAYLPIHSSDAIQRNLSPSQCLGRLADAKGGEADVQMGQTQDEMRVEREMKRRPPLNQILNLTDIENVAKKVLPHPVLAFYSAGTDDELSLRENSRAFDRFFFHPRVMRPVSICDPSTKILGYHSSLPIFVSGAAQAILGHSQGELNITRACGKANIIQMVCTYASIPRAQIAAAALPSQPLFFQLYKVTDTAASAKVVQEAEQLGYKAIVLTVDAVVVGNRERDVKSLWVLEQQEGKTQYYFEGDPESATNLFGSSAVNRRHAFDSDLSWKETIPWLRSITKLPIILKGIQCVEDAMLAVEAGVEAILVSNHGGRQLETSLPPLEVLYRIRHQQPDIFDKLEVYIDGGIRRGTDVIKAVCLGAKAVGLGRPFLYALSAYGEAGVTKMLDVLHREITISMQLLGAASIRDLTPEMVERVDWEPVRQRNTKL
ncbi:FMN-dependent dehydrogenase-domain-containing protein [Lentinula detonsa]|uniref:L-lactate dehydrogenase (cytochrome) n=1 Tax=Lentinula detonsa TaxID=2804962 RepID=A0AA38PV21_9AGAR|nr:FMN-dependent dehydrogenase-domain-containing protein [Lentinula detonsa]